MNLMTGVGVVTSIAVLGVVAWVGAVAVKATWRSAAGRGGDYLIVP